MGSIENFWWKKGLPPPALGKKVSEDTKAKIRVARSKQIIPMTAETKKKIKESLLKKSEYFSNRYKGSKSNLWKGGVSKTNQLIRSSASFKKWRMSVFERDEWTCQVCSQKGKVLHPHHIKNFASDTENRFNIDNGITLCKPCHNKFHKQYGIKNNNLEQILEFRRSNNDTNRC